MCAAVYNYKVFKRFVLQVAGFVLILPMFRFLSNVFFQEPISLFFAYTRMYVLNIRSMFDVAKKLASMVARL